MKTADRVLGWLLVLSGLLHAFGSWTGYLDSSEMLLWALSGSLAALLVAALNLRVNRPTDRPLALIALAGAVAWTGIALGFGAVIGSVLDPRALIHAVIAIALAAMSLRTLVGSSPKSARVAA